MTIKYLDSKRISALAADTKPTNVETNSILVEKDTGRRYWFDLGVEPKGTSGTGGDWAEVSFNASSAVGGATTSGNVVTRTSGSGWNSYIRSNEYISPSTGGGEIYFTHSNTANVSVGLEKSPFNSAPTAVYTGKDYSFHTTNASNNMYEGTSDYAGTAWASATNEFRITMDSAGLVKYYWRSGSSGTWTLERTSTVTASGDYYMAVSPASGTTTCFIKGTPATWTMEPTFADDFTSNTGWTQTGTTVTVNSGIAGKAAYVSSSGASTDRVSKGLGITLSDSLWCADFDFQATTMTAGGDDAQGAVFSLCSTTGTPRSGTQDNIMMFIYNSGGTTYLLSYARDGTSTSVSSGIIISLSTQYYCRLQRTSATGARLSVFSDADRTIPISGSPVNYTIPSTINTLTTLVIGSGAGAGSSTISLDIDNAKIYDGVTTPN